MPTAGLSSKPMKKIRCKVCHKWFLPTRKDSKTCSRECSVENARKLSIERYHNLHPEAAYGRRIESKEKKKKSFLDTKIDRRSARSKIRDILRSDEQTTTLTKDDKKQVEYVMSLPVEQRWSAGAKDWTPEQRKFAQKIEIKRISSDFSSIFASFDTRSFSSASFDDVKKKKKDELPYKFDAMTDDSDDSSSTDDESGDSTADNDDEVQEIAETSSYQVEDEELDATDEENQF